MLYKQNLSLTTLTRYIKSADCISSLPCYPSIMSPVRTQHISLIHSEFPTFESANVTSPTQTQERMVSHKMDSKFKMAKATETTP